MPSFRTIAGFGALAASIAARGRRRSKPRSLDERLAMVPTRGLPVDSAVVMRWNDQMVPFVQAASDRDAAVALGVAHAHLRLAQMEIMRRIAHGRLSESVGPAAIDLDHVLRCLDLGRAVPAIEAGMPDETRVWMQGFADGVNHVIAETDELPEDLRLLGLKPEPWTLTDLVRIGRLAGLDFTWKVWRKLFRLRGRADWLRQWQRLTAQAGAPLPSLSGGDGDLLFGFSRHGSNSVAVGARRTGGGAMIASDPHLNVVLPNLWLIAGVDCPGYNVVGFMVPGIPAWALGRNPDIAWGGTSLHAASSELFDVSDLPADEIEHRRETIRVRWWKDVEITVRETAYGPIVSDAPLLGTPPEAPLALHWVGHTPTDEVTALLRMNRARDWGEFREALDGFGIPAQNMVYADARGRVGQIMAAKLPRRPREIPDDMVVPRSARSHWESFCGAKELPAVFDPAEGFVASANNRPEHRPEVAVSWFFAPDDRVRRLAMLITGAGTVTADTLKALQRDVVMPGALAIRDALLAIAENRGLRTNDPAIKRLFAALDGWDGGYEADSAGALAFELLLYHFVHALHGDEEIAVYAASWEPWALLREDLDTVPPDQQGKALAQALVAAAAGLERYGNWGSLHRLRLNHVLGAAPVVGARYRFADIASPGGNETVMKAAHGFSGERHAVRMGAVARHVSDLADADANWFCLLGGQDGWIGSAAFIDQLQRWRRGEYVQVPLRWQTVRTHFRHRMELQPRGKP